MLKARCILTILEELMYSVRSSDRLSKHSVCQNRRDDKMLIPPYAVAEQSVTIHEKVSK